MEAFTNELHKVRVFSEDYSETGPKGEYLVVYDPDMTGYPSCIEQPLSIRYRVNFRNECLNADAEIVID